MRREARRAASSKAVTKLPIEKKRQLLCCWRGFGGNQRDRRSRWVVGNLGAARQPQDRLSGREVALLDRDAPTVREHRNRGDRVLPSRNSLFFWCVKRLTYQVYQCVDGLLCQRVVEAYEIVG